MAEAPASSFHRSTKVLNFDQNATAPLSDAARTAWLEATERFPGNPSSPHRLGARADRALEEARERLAARLGCGAHEIVWTAGATEAVNTAVAHLAAEGAGRGGDLGRSSIRACCSRRGMGWRATVELLPATRGGRGGPRARWQERSRRSGRVSSR